VLSLFGQHVLRTDKAAARQSDKPTDKNAGPTRPPIIILPNTTTSCLSMLNALEFLRDGVFISGDEKRKNGASREASVLLKRTDPVTGSVKMYKLMDNPATLSSDDWERVVAVFVSGMAWQFKGWKWPNPVDLFKNVMGVYLTFDDRNVDKNVTSWACKTLKVSEHFMQCQIIASFVRFV
jgi:parafibromin